MLVYINVVDKKGGCCSLDGKRVLLKMSDFVQVMIKGVLFIFSNPFSLNK